MMTAGASSPDRPRLLLTSAMAQHANSRLERLEEAGFELVEGYDIASSTSPHDLARALDGIWGTVAGSEPYTREVLQQAASLRVIARCGVGYDAIDVDAATENGVAVLITPEGNFESVADFALALMLALVRRLVLADRAVRSGRWRPTELTGDLAQATVGIVGLGRIGRAVAQRLGGFGCRILGVETQPELTVCAQLGIEFMTLEQVLPLVDVLTLHVPRTSETYHLIGARELSMMKRSAILVNTARGGIVDEWALFEALNAGSLAGAGLDVFEQEPIADDHPLLQCSNVILSGHVSAFTRLATEKTLDAVVAGLLDIAAGRMPAGWVNPPVAVHE
jgi:D-3-phosphoglycerate dehydrogenase